MKLDIRISETGCEYDSNEENSIKGRSEMIAHKHMAIVPAETKI